MDPETLWHLRILQEAQCNRNDIKNRRIPKPLRIFWYILVGITAYTTIAIIAITTAILTLWILFH
jgi:hypothetical protein